MCIQYTLIYVVDIRGFTLKTRLSLIVTSPTDKNKMRLSIVNAATSHYRLVVLGGGTAGTAVSNNFRKLIPKGQMAVIEPFKDHYYQPGFTLVGGGFKTLDTMVRPTASYLNPDAVWIQQAAEELQPKNNAIVLA
ncbi:hypothetical protein AB6A40_006892 [Gnathostoma spinigerum]|uniref:Glucose-methanol-choline oxidoreductase N-terminal domain-containing protein n=1 Tax=Gnathostoma spinigerum TaxID=75299 RepID=A0ABD6EJN5_9BILA